VVSYLSLAADIGVTALPVATAVVHGAVIPQVETKMVPMMTTVMTMNETCHGAPSNPLSNPCLREGKGKGNEDKGGNCCCGRP
jgi:hypothetical protein